MPYVVSTSALLSTASVALHKACQRGQLDLVEQALRDGASVSAPDEKGYTAMHHFGACRSRSAEVHETLLQRLLDAGGDLDSRTPNNDPPTFVAASQNRWWLVDLMVRRGASVTAIPVGPDGHHGSWGHHALLSWAAQNGRVSSVRLLLNHGADVNAESKNGYTALTNLLGIMGPMRNPTFMARLTRVMNVLLKCGASVVGNPAGNPFVTPMAMAVQYGAEDVLPRLIAAGAWHDDPRWQVLEHQVGLVQRAITHTRPRALGLLIDHGWGRSWPSSVWEDLVQEAQAMLTRPSQDSHLKSEVERQQEHASRSQVLAIVEGVLLHQVLPKQGASNDSTMDPLAASSRARPRL